MQTQEPKMNVVPWEGIDLMNLKMPSSSPVDLRRAPLPGAPAVGV
jgi:hypothetical protein